MRAIAPYRWAIIGYAVIAALFVTSERSKVLHVLDSRGVPVSFWDVPLQAASSGYLFTFLLAPVALFCALSQVRPRAAWENIARYPTRTDWILAQAHLALPWIGAMVATTAVVAVAGGLGFAGAEGWGVASSSSSVIGQLPTLAPVLPHPVLALVLQLAASAAALALVVLIVAAGASSLAHPRVAEVTGAGVLAWTLVSFPLGTGLVGTPVGTLILSLAPDTYYSTPLAAEVFGLGPAGGIAVLLVVVTLVVLAVRALEVRRARTAVERPDARLAILLGAVLVLAGLAALSIPSLAVSADRVAPAPAALVMLQGAGATSGSLMPVTGMALLVVLPALAVHRSFVAALTGRRFAEMVRLGSPGRWLRRHLRSAVAAAAGYAVWCGATALVLVWVWSGLDLAAVRLVGVWALALGLQVVVLVLALVLGTTIARSATGGAVALGVAFVLSWPLGHMSALSPFGQASLLRLVDVDDPAALTPTALNLAPLVALAVWAVLLGVITSFVFSRTRGEIE